jgi:TetR/AcrR family transcriptional repressor of nem operon
MRYDSEHKARTRARLLKEAAATIRAVGPGGVGVAGLMAQAGLTHGGFYAHFKSKDELIAQAIDRMFEDSRALFEACTEGRTPADGLTRYIDAYLSEQHRDRADRGCPLPCLSGEIAHMPDAARKCFAAGAAGLAAGIAGLLASIGMQNADPVAASIMSELTGAIGLARAIPERARSDMILEASRDALKARLGLGSAA